MQPADSWCLGKSVRTATLTAAHAPTCQRAIHAHRRTRTNAHSEAAWVLRGQAGRLGSCAALTMRSCVHRFQCRWLLNIFSQDSSAAQGEGSTARG